MVDENLIGKVGGDKSIVFSGTKMTPAEFDAFTKRAFNLAGEVWDAYTKRAEYCR